MARGRISQDDVIAAIGILVVLAVVLTIAKIDREDRRPARISQGETSRAAL